MCFFQFLWSVVWTAANGTSKCSSWKNFTSSLAPIGHKCWCWKTCGSAPAQQGHIDSNLQCKVSFFCLLMALSFKNHLPDMEKAIQYMPQETTHAQCAYNSVVTWYLHQVTNWTPPGHLVEFLKYHQVTFWPSWCLEECRKIAWWCNN